MFLSKALVLMLFIYLVHSRGGHFNQSTKTADKNRLSNQIPPGTDINVIGDNYNPGSIAEEDKDEFRIDVDEESSGDFEPIDKLKSNRISKEEDRDVLKRYKDKEEDRDVLKRYKDNVVIKESWVQYKYEKSYILLNRTATKVEAERICDLFNKDGQSGASLAVPQSDEEQRFINDYVFNMRRSFKNVWIAQITDNYRNYSHRQKLYQNWGKGLPTLTKRCIQIRSPLSVYNDVYNAIGGKWEDVSCFRMNLVLCQRPQHWSEEQFIRIVKDLKREVEALKRGTSLDSADAVPLHYIYIQLPKQAEPKYLWPQFEWTDISPLYGGLFFRTLGGNSAPFGRIQEASCPRLTGVKSYGVHGVPQVDLRIYEMYADGQWMDDRYGYKSGYPVSFMVSSSEVRPKNTAIKVWKRTN